MNKRLIALNIAILTLLIAPYVIQQVNAATANAYAYHPTCKLFGKVKKDWYIGRKWQEYKDDQGLSSFLPFNRTNENITISFANIVFDKNFVNKTIADATESGSTTEFTVTKEVLTSNGLEYIYIKMTNKTALSASTTYTVNEELLVSDEPAVDNNDYIFVTAKVKKTGDNIAQWQAYVIFYFLDSGATERKLYIKVAGQSGTDTWASGTDYVAYLDYDRDDTYVTWQFKIQDMLDAQSKTWQIVKLTKVRYVIELVTGDTLDATSVVEAYIRHAFIASGKIYIDDPFYENGLIVNGTSGQFTPSAGDIIQIYGANATKIVGVTIPFVYEDIRDFDEICTALAECYGFQYEWKFILPKSPETGDKLEYSNTNITLKCWFDGSFVDRLYVNGVDKTTQVSGKKVDTSEGIQDKDRAWTYLVASSLTAGNQYDVELKIKDLPKQIWYDLTTEPTRILTWEWLYDKLLVILAFFSNLLGGIGSSWIKSQREKLRVPKR